MAVTGYTPEAIQAAILASLVGQTLTGTNLSSSLHMSEDDIEPGLGAYPMKDGGVLVFYTGGDSTGSSAPQTSGGRIQRQWAERFRARVSYAVGGVTGQKLAVDVASFGRQIVNAIEAGLEPQSGTTIYTVMSIGLAPVIRSPAAPGFYIQDCNVIVNAFWART